MADVLKSYKDKIFDIEKTLQSQKPINKLYRINLKRQLFEQEEIQTFWTRNCSCCVGKPISRDDHINSKADKLKNHLKQ